LAVVERCIRDHPARLLRTPLRVQRWTATNTELIVVDPRRNIRRVVTTLPQSVTVHTPGATA
jgi:hypothetical protein